MRLIGRIFLVVALATGVVWGVWSYALGRPDVQFGLYERAVTARHAAGALALAAPSAFRATICAASPCVLVEAGGRTLLVGAGNGAAEGLESLGLLKSDLDGVLLTDLSAASIDGLAAVRNATWRAGRQKPLEVYGPVGIHKVVDGLNAMLEASDTAQANLLAEGVLAKENAILVIGASLAVLDPIAPPSTTQAILQAGPVSVSRVAVGEGEREWAYRIVYQERMLVVAGCGARAGDLATALAGSKSAWVVAPVVSQALMDIDLKAALAAGRERAASMASAAARPCLAAEQADNMLERAGVVGGLAAPVFPAADSPAAVRAWRKALGEQGVKILGLGAPGDQLDLALPSLPTAAPEGPEEPAAAPEQPAAPTPVAVASSTSAPNAPATNAPATSAPAVAESPAPVVTKPPSAAASPARPRAPRPSPSPAAETASSPASDTQPDSPLADEPFP